MSDNYAKVAAGCLVLFGMTARMVRYLQNPSLWGDEAAIALNIIRRPFADLLRPLDFSQGAPPGFLILEKAVFSLCGSSEYSLRLLPLLASLAAIPLFHAIVVRIGGRREALLALSLFVFSEPLIFYAVQVKQYSLEVFACLTILTATLSPVKRGWSPVNICVLFLTGAGSLLLSYSAVFVCAGMGLFLTVRFLAGRRYADMAVTASISLAWAALFMVLYLLYFRKLRDMPFLMDYWKGFYLAPAPWSLADLQWGFKAFVRYFRDPLYLSSAWLGAGIFMLGLARLLLLGKRVLAMIISPLLFLFMAQLFRLMPVPSGSVDVSAPVTYPFNGRLVLFTVPLALMVLSFGLVSLANLGRRRVGKAGYAAVAVVLSVLLYQAAWSLFSNPAIQDVRPLFREMVAKSHRGDVYFVQSYGQVVVDYYSLREGVSLQPRAIAFRTAADAARVSEQVAGLPKGQRFWLITLYHPAWRNEKERDHILKYVATSVSRLLTLSRAGVTSDLLVRL